MTQLPSDHRADPAGLDYAPPRSWVRRRWGRLVLLALAVGLLAAGAIWHRDLAAAASRARLLYAQRRCMTFEPPPDRVAYEEDPQKVQALAGQSDYRAVAGPDGKPAAVIFWPKAARDWPEMNRYGWLGTQPAVIFMHEMRTPKGRRLLVLSTAAHRSGMRDGVEIRVQAVEPATWRRPSRSAHGMATFLSKPPSDRDANVPLEDTPPLRIYAGRVDPSDPSRFTVDYEGGGHRGHMEGRLRDDSDGGVDIDWGQWTTGWATPSAR